MDDFDDLMPRMSAAAQPHGDREKRGAERPAADAATPDVYEAVQAARGSASEGSSRPPRRRTSKTPGKTGSRASAPVKARADAPAKDLDVPATVSALAIGAVVGFLIGFFSAKGGK
jgi:hypothetical protein